MSNEQKKRKAEDNIVSLSVGDPAKAASLAIDQSHLDEYFGGQETESSVIQCVKPPKGVYFTVMPEPTKRRDPYFVTPDIAKIKADEDVLRPILLVRYVTMPGIEGLWPIKINPPDGRANLWNASARNIMELAANGTPKEPGQKWIRLKSGKGHYGHQVSPKTIDNTPPQFSSRTFLELVDIASEGRVVAALQDYCLADDCQNTLDLFLKMRHRIDFMRAPIRGGLHDGARTRPLARNPH